MVRTLIVLSVMLVFSLQEGYSCDACGCSINGGGVGLLASYKSNFVGISWSNTKFIGVQGHGSGGTDIFNNIELSVRYHFSARFKMQLNQPYRFNTRKVGESTNGVQGISDTRIVGSYTLLKNLQIGESAKLFFELGAGVKLPTGAYDKDLRDSNLPENFNIGNGSWGYLFQPNILLSRKSAGLVINGNFQYNKATKDGYKFGNQFSSQLLFFWDKLLDNGFSIVPNSGVYFEKITSDRYAYGAKTPGTGGKGLFLSTGLNLKHQNWNLGFSYVLPMDQSYSDGSVDAKGRMNCQISYIF